VVRRYLRVSGEKQKEKLAEKNKQPDGSNEDVI
jgi:hypothetical protein